MNAKFNLPSQRKLFKSKNKTWRKECMDYFVSQANDQYSNNWERMQRNYNMYNNIIHQDDFQKYCDPLGLDVGQGKDYVQAFNQSHNKINVLQGEESKLPWKYTVLAINESASNEVLRQKTRDYRDYVQFQLKKEIQQQQAIMQQKIAAEVQGVQDPQEQSELMQQLMQELQMEEQQILNPEQIEKKYRNFLLDEERLLNTILKKAVIADKLKHKKNQAYFHALVAGIEAVEVSPINDIETVTILNPLGLAYHKSPETQFIQDGDWVVYKQEMTLGDVLDTYGTVLNKKDLDELNTAAGYIYGTDAKMYSKDGYSPSHWEHLKNKSTTGNFSINGVLHSGAYGQSIANTGDYLTVYTAYWKSQRKVGFLSWKDEYGQMQEDIVDEAYPVPEDAKLSTTKDKVSGAKIETWSWTENEIFYQLQWDWIPQTWRGTQIEENIYCDIEPVEWAVQSLENPKQHKLPVYGAAYNAVNAPITSQFDRMVPWQNFYYFVMSKFLKLISQDRGVISTFNTLLVDEDLGTEMTLQYMFDTGILPFNPMQNKEAAAYLGNTLKMAEGINLSNSQQISHYADILRFIEQQIGIAAGVPPQREAKTSSSSNVTDNQQDLVQSGYITQTTLALHNLIWQDVLTAVAVLGKRRLAQGNSKTMRFYLDDDQIALLNINPDALDLLDVGVYVANNDKAHQVLQIAQQQATALLQNDRTNFSTFISMLETEDLSELKKEIREMEQDLEGREERMQQAQQEHQERVQQMELESREDQQAHEVQLKQMDIDGKLQVESMRVWMGQQTLDADKDGIPDPIEAAKLQKELIESEGNLSIEEQKILLEQQKVAQKDKEIESNERIKEKEIEAKKQIAKMKPKPTSK